MIIGQRIVDMVAAQLEIIESVAYVTTPPATPGAIRIGTALLREDGWELPTDAPTDVAVAAGTIEGIAVALGIGVRQLVESAQVRVEHRRAARHESSGRLLAPREGLAEDDPFADLLWIYFGTSREVATAILRALAVVPPEVASFVERDITFVSAGETNPVWVLPNPAAIYPIDIDSMIITIWDHAPALDELMIEKLAEAWLLDRGDLPSADEVSRLVATWKRSRSCAEPILDEEKLE